MALAKTARRLAALALTIGAVWLFDVRASADTEFGDGAVIKEVREVTQLQEINELGERDYRGKTVILHSNDTNGAVMGFPRMAWLKHEFERLGAETILVDAGNFSVGAIYASNAGADAVKLMNLTGYHVATLGGYDLAYGYDALRRNLRRAAFPILCANALENGENICAPNYSYTTQSGVTIGFFGLLTPNAIINFSSAQTHDIQIYERRDIYKCVQAQIDALRQGGNVIPGADLVIALSGVGSAGKPTPKGYSSLDIFTKTDGIDLILDGLNKTPMTVGKNGEQVQSCGESFAYIGVVVIDDAKKAIEDRYLIPTEGAPEDPDVLKAAEMLQNRYKMDYGAVFARTETNLNGESVPGNRTEETNLGDLIADALVRTARRELKNPLVDAKRLIGLTNGASIRAGLSDENVTKRHINEMFSFGDTVSVVYVTGAELLEVLEAATRSLPEKENNYPQTSGIVFTIDERVPYDAGSPYPDSEFPRPATIGRVRVESVRGEPFDPDALYGVATNNYCAGGAEAFYLFGAAKERYDSMTSVEQSVTDYIKLALGGVVTETMYGEPRGDHTILS